MSAAAVAPVGDATLPTAAGAKAAALGVGERINLFLASRWGAFAMIALALTFPMIDASLGLGMMNPMLRILTSVMLAIGLNVVVGFAGLLDLGYVAFWAIGAYVVGWFASGQFSTVHLSLLSGVPSTMPGIHVSIWLLFIVAAVVTALFGVLLGAPTLRLRGDYLAIVTLGFGEIVPKLFQNGDNIAGHNLTNGTRGISGLDAPSLGGPAVDNVLGLGWGSWGPLNLLPWYYLGLLLVAICWYVAATMQWSKLGRAWMAIREDETAASAMGIDLVRTKLWAYGIGAALGGMAGVYHGARIGSIFPASFQFYISISVLCMVIIGGMGNIAGAVLGAFAIEGLNFWLLPSLSGWAKAAGVNIDLTSWNLLIFGVLLVVMMLYRPQGFLPAKARIIQFDEDDIGDDVPVTVYAQAGDVADTAIDTERHDHLLDVEPAAHVDHYPAAFQGPQSHSHPVLQATPSHSIPRPTSQNFHVPEGEGVPRPRSAPPVVPPGAGTPDAYRPGIVGAPAQPPPVDLAAASGNPAAPVGPQGPAQPEPPAGGRKPFSFSRWEGTAWRTS